VKPALLVIVVLVVALGCRPASKVQVTQDLRYIGFELLDVYTSSSPATGRPVIVTLHGCCGDKQDLSLLAYRLAEDGAVVFNASWRTLRRGGGFPVSYQDVACAVRFARATATDRGGDPRRITVVGWSDGALPGAVVANAGDDFPGDCPVEGASALPDAFVGVSGFPGWSGRGGAVDPGLVNEDTVRFFGGTPATAARAWSAGNAYTDLGRNRGLQVRLVIGGDDPLLAENVCFARASQRAGHETKLTVVRNAAELSLIAPRTPEGRAAVDEIMAAARGERVHGTEAVAAPAQGCPGEGSSP